MALQAQTVIPLNQMFESLRLRKCTVLDEILTIKMPRKAEIQAEEIVPGSPLRRSSRRTALTNSPAPATLNPRRNLQSQTEAIETKTPKTRRASLSQENLEKNEITENKPAPRGRKGSTAKEDTDEKIEPAKTRSRRSSAATEPHAEETEKKQITRRRKSIAVEEQAEPESFKPVRSRRSSVDDDTVKKPVKSRRNSAKEEEEATEEPPKKILRSRRSSAAEENPVVETKEKKSQPRGRRSSTDKPDDEPDNKTGKLTPIKSKRRVSITENAVNLDPIEEQESETKDSSNTSPPKSELKEAYVVLNKETRTNLDLSTINELSFTEENTSEKKVVTPRKSPRLNKEKVHDSNNHLTPTESTKMDKEIVDSEQSKMITEKTEDAINEGKESPDKEAEQNKDLEIENVNETKSKEKIIIKTANESLEKGSSSPRKKLAFEHETTVELVEAKEIDIKENVQLNHDKSDSNTESIDQSVLEVECEQEKEYNKQIEVETNKTSNLDATFGSEESFNFHLNVSNMSELQDDNMEDALNTTKNSSSSDKENIEINSTDQDDNEENSLNTSKNSSCSDKENIEINSIKYPTSTQKKIKNIIESSGQIIQKEVQIVVGRVSNVFRPNMKENSFMEPMEVDEFPSILDTTQSKKSLDLEESDSENVLPTMSTPIVKRSIEKVETESKGHMEEINENAHKQNIKASKSTEELTDEPENISRVLTVNSEVTLEESEALYISKQIVASKEEHTKGGRASDTLPEDTINMETTEDTKMSSDITIEVKKSDQSESVTNLTIIVQERVEICESSLSEEEIEKEDSYRVPEESSLETVDEVKTEETLTMGSPQHQQEDIKIEESKSSIQMIPEDVIKPIEKSEVENEKNESTKSESHLTENTNIDEIKNETEKFSEDSESAVKDLDVKLENEQILMKSISPQPDLSSDGLKPLEPGESLQESKSLSRNNENSEMEQNRETKLSEVSKRSAERQETEMDQNKENVSRKSENPQPQVSTEILKPEDHEILLPKSVSEEMDTSENETENLNVKLNQDEICPRKSNSPQPDNEGITEGGEMFLTTEKLNDSSEHISESESPRELNDLESEPEAQTVSPVKTKITLQEPQKMDISEDYEFEIPSDDEEVDKSRKSRLEEDATESDYKLVAESSPSSPLKIKSVDSEVDQNKEIKLASKSEENVQQDSKYASDLKITSPVPDKITDTKAAVEEPTNKADIKEDSDESARDDLIKENLPGNQNIRETNVKESESNNELFTKKKVVEENFEEEPDINKEIPCQKEITEAENIFIQNKIQDSNISVIDTQENVNTNRDSTFEESSTQMNVIEIEQSGEMETGVELVQNEVSNLKEKNKNKKKSKTIKDSSVKTTEIDVNGSHNVKEIDSRNELDIMESDFQDVVQDSSDIKKRKKVKVKSKKQIEISKQNKHEVQEEEESQLEEISEDITVESRSPSRKKSKKASSVNISLIEENSYDDEIEGEKNMEKSKNVPIVDKKKIESGTKKKSKKSLAEESIEEELNSNKKKGKKNKKLKKPAEDVIYLESEEDNENQKKNAKELDSNDLPREQLLEGLDAAAESKLDKYLSAKIQEMETEDESYCTYTNEEEDNSEEDNEFIYTMAEEGEEDTPSEGSNDIIDEGESIHSTESEIDSEDSYDVDDPFICDEEEGELLSGEEYDLGDEKMKKKEKKSRIIQLDDCNDEIIKIKRKEKPVKKTKRSRIISVSDSSDSEVDNRNDTVESSNKSLEEINDVIKEEIDDDVIILEEKSTPVQFSKSQVASELNSSTVNTVESATMKRKKSIIIHENINVAEIKNPEFSEKIASVVDTFCNKIYGGEISMNLSLEHAVDSTAESSKYDDVFIECPKDKKDKHFKRNLDDSDDSEESSERKVSKKHQRLSVSLDNIEDSDKSKQRSRKKRKSGSLDDLTRSKAKESKIDTMKNMGKTSHSKKKIKLQKRNNGSKPPKSLTDDLRIRTMSIMDQLITDVKNRPVRTIRPSTTVINMNGSWVSEVADDVKPSTTLIRGSETAEYKPRKIHPKDFRNQMLYDSSRVRRVDTKTLLRKRGAYF